MPSPVTRRRLIATVVVWFTFSLLAGFFVLVKLDHFAVPPSPRPLMVVISGDTAGWIVPCGCTSNQSGGLLRRGTFVKEQAARHDVVLADAGGAASGTSPYHQVKFEAILRGERQMELQMHNLGASEAAMGAEYLRKLPEALKAVFVSANVRDDKGQPFASSIHFLERAGKRLAITGVLSKRFSGPGIQVLEPREALLELITQYRGNYDSLLVLAYVPEEELTQLAAAVPEADAFIGGPTGQTVTPRNVGSVLVASATNKGKYLVCLEADAGKKTSWTAKIVELNGAFADDADQQRNVRAYLNELGQRDIAAAETGFVPTLALRHDEQFKVAGTQSCLPCHQDDCKQWDGSKHGHAWKTLVDKGYHVDSYCQQCHTTGFGQGGGFASVRRSPERVSVGCESCHGPSAAHVANTKTRTPFAAKDQCIRCHDHENSPLFEYDKYWPRIVHGGRTNPSPQR